MTARGWICVVALWLAVTAVASGAPLAGEDLRLSTIRDRPLPVRVVVTDPGTDPQSPESHRVEFSILDAPRHGTLVGRLDAVSYEPGGVVALVVTYAPAARFTGTDTFRVAARDPGGEEATVAVTVDVVLRSAAGQLSGRSTVAVAVDVEAATVTAWDWTVDAKLCIDAISFETGLRFKRDAVDTGFDDLVARMAAPVAGIGAASVRFDFNPGMPADLFDSAEAALSLSLPNLTLSGSLFTDGTPVGARMSVAFSGAPEEGTLLVNGRATFTTCALGFDSASLTLRMPHAADCIEELSATVAFSSSGFDQFSLLASGVDLPDVGWLTAVPSASVALAYRVEEKTLSIQPEIDAPWTECIQLGLEAEWVDTTLTALRLAWIRLDCTLVEGVRLRMQSSLDPTDLALNESVTGFLDYWESTVLSGRFRPCAGLDGTWEVRAYFARPGVGAQLFDLGRLDLRASLACGRLWGLSSDFIFRTGAFGGPTAEWMLGFEMTW